jgi:hypothetical protein
MKFYGTGRLTGDDGIPDVPVTHDPAIVINRNRDQIDSPWQVRQIRMVGNVPLAGSEQSPALCDRNRFLGPTSAGSATNLDFNHDDEFTVDHHEVDFATFRPPVGVHEPESVTFKDASCVPLAEGTEFRAGSCHSTLSGSTP